MASRVRWSSQGLCARSTCIRRSALGPRARPPVSRGTSSEGEGDRLQADDGALIQGAGQSLFSAPPAGVWLCRSCLGVIVICVEPLPGGTPHVMLPSDSSPRAWLEKARTHAAAFVAPRSTGSDPGQRPRSGGPFALPTMPARSQWSRPHRSVESVWLPCRCQATYEGWRGCGSRRWRVIEVAMFAVAPSRRLIYCDVRLLMVGSCRGVFSTENETCTFGECTACSDEPSVASQVRGDAPTRRAREANGGADIRPSGADTRRTVAEDL